MIAYWERDCEWMSDGLQLAICPSFTGPTGLAALDVSSRSGHGTLTNMDPNTAWVTSGGEIASGFDGANDFVNITANLSALISSKVFTFSTWIKTSATNANTYPFSAGNTASDTPYLGFRLDPSGNGQTQFFYRDSASNTVIPGAGVAVNNGQWNQLVAVANASTLQVHVNGLAYGSAASIATFGASTINRATIGALGRTTVIVHFSGQVDDSRIYSRALTAPEIRQLYERDRGGGMLYQPPRKRSYFAQVTTFKNYWFRSQQQMIGGGIR